MTELLGGERSSSKFTKGERKKLSRGKVVGGCSIDVAKKQAASPFRPSHVVEENRVRRHRITRERKKEGIATCSNRMLLSSRDNV